MAEVRELLQALTLAEKAALTAGEDMLSTVPIERLGIPKIHVTDGPAGARGLSYPGLGGPSSTFIPCGSAIGATWNPELAGRLAALVAREARDRGCRGLLAPAVNLHRSPLAGRNFECYSEDPLLSGRLAAAYVRGVQSQGVFATVKHLVGNDAEFERTTISSVIDDRALRELYLLPFEIAVREGGALAVMTAYNRLNGRWLSQQGEYLQGILRDEWGFDGLVMTDWHAIADTSLSLAAGLDLEMPGPGRALGSHVVPAIDDGRVDEDDLDAAVRHQLTVYDRIGALDEPALPVSPVPPGDGDLALLRQAAAEATVLLTNDGILPLEPAKLRRIAVLGPHATAPALGGGGSSEVIPHRVVTPLAAVLAAVGDAAEVMHERGCEANLSAVVIGGSAMPAPDGFAVQVYAGPDSTGGIVDERWLDDLRVNVFSSLAQGWPEGTWSLRARGMVTPQETGEFQLALVQAGRARVLIDGRTVLDGFADPPPLGGREFFGFASQELTTTVTLTAGVPVEIVVEYTRVVEGPAGFRVGFRTVDLDALIERAAITASRADVAVVFVGTSAEYESETIDRDSLVLPGRQADLIHRVAAANPRTVVIVNSGAPVDMTWADEVAAVLQCWFGGQEMAAAVTDVLLGLSDPGGRLPTTIPVRLEHNPSYDNFPGENNEIRYGESIFMGYRGYEHRCIAPRFPFGHGLSYTTFAVGEASSSAAVFRRGETLTVRLPVTNTGDRAGSHVVQCYVGPPPSRLSRPPKELKAFAKLFLAPGETVVAELTLDQRAFAYWDPGPRDHELLAAHPVTSIIPTKPPAEHSGEPGWRVDPGRYEILLGWSSTDIFCRVPVEVAETQ